MSTGETLSNWLAVILSLSLHFVAVAEERTATPIANPNLENAHKLTEKILAGAEPHDEKALAALREMGVKTILSVDGAKPNVELAKKFNLRYVHIPIGYDGVRDECAKEIAKALTELDGPIYVHCHHGMHRAPAAAATACVYAGVLNNNEALGVMKKMGTGEGYLGLWDSARRAKPAAPGELAALKVEFKETTPIPPLADAMVRIDEALEHITACKKAGWTAPKDHPDLDPSHEALKLRELLAESLRTPDAQRRPDDFKKWLSESIDTTQRLETLLVKKERADFDALYTSIKNDCGACHKAYRNVKAK